VKIWHQIVGFTTPPPPTNSFFGGEFSQLGDFFGGKWKNSANSK